MIHVIAIITAKAGKRQQVLDIFRNNIPAVLAEPGCLEYSAAIDAPEAAPAFGPDVLVAVEKWESHDALRAHAASAHMRAYVAHTAGLVDHVAVHVLDPAA